MKTNAQLAALFSNACASGMMCFARATNLCYHLMRCENIPGDVVEFGSHKGHTAAMLAAITKKQVWCVDSFRGLPPKSSHDITDPKFVEGSLKCEQAVLEKTFLDAGLPLPKIIPKWFKEVRPIELPQKIAFCHIDSDFYHSTLSALELAYPKLSHDAACFIDDMPYTGLPGVKVAVESFLTGRPERNRMMQFRGPCTEVTMHCMFRKCG